MVSWLLDAEPGARLIPVRLPPADASGAAGWQRASQLWPCRESGPRREGARPCCLRFDPLRSRTGGLFLAKLVKVAEG